MIMAKSWRICLNYLLIAEMHSNFRNCCCSLPQAVLIEIEMTVMMTCGNLGAIHHIQRTTAMLLHALHEVTAVLAAAHVYIFHYLVIVAFIFNKLCYLVA